MVRQKTYSRSLSSCCLIALLTFLSSLAFAQDFNIGVVTQVEGESTFFSYLPPRSVKNVKLKQDAQTEGSYLTHEDAFLTFKLFTQNYLRLNPKSKISLEYNPKEKLLTVHLFSGSFKALFSKNENNPRVQKLIVKSADTYFETVNGKFTVVRNVLDGTNSVYVEKGSIVVTQYAGLEVKDTEIVHARETTSVADNKSDIGPPQALNDKQIKFLHPSFYLSKKTIQ